MTERQKIKIYLCFSLQSIVNKQKHTVEKFQQNLGFLSYLRYDKNVIRNNIQQKVK